MKNWVLKDMIRYDAEKRVRTALVKSGGLAIEMVCYEPGQHTVTHHHPRQDEVFYIVEGRGTFTIGEERIAVEPSSVIFVAAHEPHGIVADAESRLVVLFAKGPGARFFDTPLNEGIAADGA